MTMKCSQCGAEIPEGSTVCPACGHQEQTEVTEAAEVTTPVEPTEPSEPTAEGTEAADENPAAFDDLLTDIEDFFGADFQAPWDPVKPETQPETPNQPEPAAAKEIPHKKHPRRHRRRWPVVLLVILLLAAAGVAAWYFLFPRESEEIQGSDSCTSLAKAYLDAAAIQGIQDPDQEKQEAKADAAALEACILPDGRTDPDDTTIFVDELTEYYGRAVSEYALGVIQISDLEDKAEQVQALEEYSGLDIQEVLLVPVGVIYEDGSGCWMNMMMVQTDAGYFLLSVER